MPKLADAFACGCAQRALPLAVGIRRRRLIEQHVTSGSSGRVTARAIRDCVQRLLTKDRRVVGWSVPR